MRRADSLEKTDAGRDWEQEEKGTTEDEMAGPEPLPRAAALVLLGVWALPTLPTGQSLISSGALPARLPETCVFLLCPVPEGTHHLT